MHQKTKILEGFSFSISPSREYSGSLSLKIDWSDLAVEGTLGVFSSATVRRHQFLVLCRYSPALTIVHDHWEDHSLDYTDLCRQSNVSAFQNTKFVIAFLLRSNGLLISRLQSLSAVILEPKKRKSVTASTFPLLFAMQLWGWMP